MFSARAFRNSCVCRNLQDISPMSSSCRPEQSCIPHRTSDTEAERGERSLQACQKNVQALTSAPFHASASSATHAFTYSPLQLPLRRAKPEGSQGEAGEKLGPHGREAKVSRNRWKPCRARANKQPQKKKSDFRTKLASRANRGDFSRIYIV